MNLEQIDRVFGRGRLKMVTGEHVEVFREAVAPGERRRYTKRFLDTREGDFGQWTEREWRILARLIGHGITCVPDVVQFDRGRIGGMRLVQTYDAGVTVDQWATLLPVIRDRRVYRHVFEDCAHWWALAHHCLLALNEIHRLELVHLDIKGDNVCIPYAPANFDPDSDDLALRPVFAQFALIDFAFALVSRESLTTPLPIGWQKEYDYQSPRLLTALEAGRNGDLRATRELDWRCDMYSLAAMLKRYLPDHGPERGARFAAGWTSERHDAAKALILRIREAHDVDPPVRRPHADLIEMTGSRLLDGELAHSLESGWALARELNVSSAHGAPLTPVTRVVPVTRITPPIRVARSGRTTAITVIPSADSRAQTPPDATATHAADIAHATPRLAFSPLLQSTQTPDATPEAAPARPSAQPRRRLGMFAALVFLGVVTASAALWYRGDGAGTSKEKLEALLAPTRAVDHGPSAAQRRVQREERPSAAADASRARESKTQERAVAMEAHPAQSTAHSTAPEAAKIPMKNAAQGEPRENAAAPLQAPARAAAATSISPLHPLPPIAASGEFAGLPSTQQLGDARVPAAERLRTIEPPTNASFASVSRAASATASSPPRAVQEPLSTYEGRTHPSWASLEPPAWVTSRKRSPGLPPGFKAREPEAPVVRAAEASLAKASPIETAASAVELAPPSVAAETPREMPSARATPPTSAATTVAGEDRRGSLRSVPRPKWFSARSAAPVEDRSENLSLALAPTPPPAARAPAAESLARGAIAAPEPASRPAEQASGAALALAEPSTRGLASSEQKRADEVAAQTQRTLTDALPRIARQGEHEVSRVLSMAASAYQPTQDRAVADAARTARIRDDASLPATTASAEARRLHDQARTSFASGRNARQALDLQLRAFNANPRDPEIAGYLAVLYLKVAPSQPDRAREAALVALTARAPNYATTRLEDWDTFAVASALSGHEADARNALFVRLALSASVDRSCVAAWNALANYGERMRAPVEAMLYRVHTRGHSYVSPWCAWPPDWSSPPRLAGSISATQWQAR